MSEVIREYWVVCGEDRASKKLHWDLGTFTGEHKILRRRFNTWVEANDSVHGWDPGCHPRVRLARVVRKKSVEVIALEKRVKELEDEVDHLQNLLEEF